MCGRYSLDIDAKALNELFSLYENDLAFHDFNIAPTTLQPVICELPNNLRAICMMKWDFTPSWQQARKTLIINARVESLDQNKPSFRDAIRHRRCLVITSGFYEWKTEEGRKQPYFFSLKSARVFALAGIWERNVNLEPMNSFAIITVPANSKVEPFHHRMPAILQRDDYKLWLDPGIQAWEAVKHLVKPYPENDLVIHPVTPKMNSPRYTNADSIKPLNSK